MAGHPDAVVGLSGALYQFPQQPTEKRNDASTKIRKRYSVFETT